MLKTRLMTGLATVAMLTPQLAFAATPQQILDRALRLSVEQPMPQATTLDMNIRGAFQPSRSLSRKLIEESGARTTPSTFHVQVIFEGESFPRAGSVMHDGQGRVRLVKLIATGDQPMNLNNLGTIEWKTINTVFYVRIAEISPAVREQLSAAGADISQLERAVGTWLKFDPEGLTSFLKEATPFEVTTSIATPSSLSDWAALSRMPSLLQVLRVEKKVTQGTQTYTRLSVRVHPSLWTRLEQQLIKSAEQELAALKKSAPREYTKQRAQRLREIRTSLQTARVEINKLRLIVMINDKTGRIERIEGGLQDKSPSYAYVYRGNKMTKIVQGQDTVNVQFAANLRGTEAKTLVEPTPFVTLQELIQRLMNMRAEAMNESMSEGEGMATP